MIRLGRYGLQAIRDHGRESYGDEACGAMFGLVDGDVRTVIRVAPLDNARNEERHRRFIVTPEDYRWAEREASLHGLTLLGFYHSHPDHPAYPSQYDLDHAFPFFSYVILAVDEGVPRAVRSFVLSDDRSRFNEESLILDSKESQPCP